MVPSFDTGSWTGRLARWGRGGRLSALALLGGALACGASTDGPSTPPASTGGSGGGAQPQAGTAGLPNPSGGMVSMPQAGSPSTGGKLGGSGSSPGGAAGAGGAAGTGGSAGGPAVDPHYKLLWRDDFDSFSDARWSKATHTFDENSAKFTAANVVVSGGFLKLSVTKVPNGEKPYSAAEVYSKEEFTFGRFAGRIKFCPGSGMVSSIFTYRDDVAASWQEIDVEHLGYIPKGIQYNLIWGSLNDRKYQPKVVNLDFSPTEAFHDYVIEWLPNGITFFIDGVQTHHDVQATIKDAARLRMNVWPTNNAVTTFAGPLNTNAIPCESHYDWVEAYSYTP